LLQRVDAEIVGIYNSWGSTNLDGSSDSSDDEYGNLYRNIYGWGRGLPFAAKVTEEGEVKRIVVWNWMK